MKKLIWIVITISFAVSAGRIGTNAYTSHRIEEKFPRLMPYYIHGEKKEIGNGDELVLLRNRGNDLHIRVERKKRWKSEPLRMVVATETKEIGVETISWPYWSKVFELDSERLDPDSLLKIKFQTNADSPFELTKLQVRTEQTQPKTLIFAFDGADMNLLRPLIDAGRCPNFKKLMQEGSYGNLLSEDPTYSPVIWTTVATGRPPKDHGITFYLAQTGLQNSSSIKVKRFWDIFSEYSVLNSFILGWYLTWPVEDLQGGMISDRSFYNFKTKNLSYPPGIFDADFEEMYTSISRNADQQLQRFTSFPFSWDWKKLYVGGSIERQNSRIVHQRLLHVLRRDSAYAEFGLNVMTKMSPDLLALYLRGADFTSHGFWKFRHPEQVPFLPVTAREQEWFRDVIDRYYIYLDEILGKYLAVSGEETTVFVLSDHGFQAVSREEGSNPEVSGAHTLNGILFCKGPYFKRGYEIPKASIYDFLPTLLYVSRLPQASDMPGRVLTDAIDPAFIARNLQKSIRTYGNRIGTEEKTSEQLEEEIKEELRSLGYIQ